MSLKGTKSKRVAVAALVATLAGAGAGPAASRSTEGVARLDGWIASSASYRFDASFLKVRWTGETQERELAAYSRLARQKGEQALHAELANKDLGRLSVDGGIGRPIAIVHETRREGMRRLLIVVEREISPRELFHKNNTSRYPYLIFDATVDADGIGEGELHPLARLEVSPDGKISYHTTGPLPLRVLNVEAS